MGVKERSSENASTSYRILLPSSVSVCEVVYIANAVKGTQSVGFALW